MTERADILERLRKRYHPLMRDAADEIERLRAFKYLHDRAVEQRTEALAEGHKMRAEIERLRGEVDSWKALVRDVEERDRRLEDVSCRQQNEIARLKRANEQDQSR